MDELIARDDAELALSKIFDDDNYREELRDAACLCRIDLAQ